MVFLCVQQPNLTSIQMPWSDALQLPVGRRSKLIEILDEIRSHEAYEIRKVR